MLLSSRLVTVAAMCAATAFVALNGRLVPTVIAASPGASVDPSDRSSVVAFYRNVYVPALSVQNDWSGSVATCDPGRTSDVYADATIQMVNYFRAMTRLPVVTRNATLDQKSQHAALMMAANRTLSHSPSSSWTCYTSTGAEAAGRSNLASGIAGAAAIVGYMADPGAGNTAVGHRRWILFPPQTEMGTGSTSQYNALWVVASGGSRSASPEVVAWPTAGFVPYQAVFPRWSFALNQSGASAPDFSRASVTMTLAGAAIPLSILPVRNGYGDNTIVWEPAGVPMAPGMPDQPISVTVSNVIVQGIARSFTYTVTIIDPARGEMPAPARAVAAPGDHVATVNGSRVTLTWRAPSDGAAPSAYRLHVGRSAGLSDVAALTVNAGATTVSAADVPVGTYYTRVVSVAADGTASAPSNEAQFTVGAVACVTPPAPGQIQAAVTGRTVSLTWTPAAGATSYIVEAGSSPSSMDLFRGDIGGATSVTAPLSPGTYFVRVRAASACGVSAGTSPEAVIQVA
jgi:uncharacterized protein YkwD